MRSNFVFKPSLESIWRFSNEKSNAAQIQDQKSCFEKQDPSSGGSAKLHAGAPVGKNIHVEIPGLFRKQRKTTYLINAK